MSKFKVGQRVFILNGDPDCCKGDGQRPKEQVGKWGTILFVEDNAYGLPYQVLTEDHKSAHWYEEEWLQSEEEHKLIGILESLNFGVGDVVEAVSNTDEFNYILLVDEIVVRGVVASTGFFPFNDYTFTKVTRGYWAVE